VLEDYLTVFLENERINPKTADFATWERERAHASPASHHGSEATTAQRPATARSNQDCEAACLDAFVQSFFLFFLQY
jgi:hypothetical protein